MSDDRPPTNRDRSRTPLDGGAGTTERERHNLSTVCRHLALVAVDGASDEVALTPAPDFCLHLAHVDTDRWGYPALIDADWATYSTRPPLDVRTAVPHREFVTVALVSD